MTSGPAVSSNCPDCLITTQQAWPRAAQVRPVPGNNVLACQVADSTGELTAVFYGRTQITGVEPGRQVRLHGMVGIGADGHPR